MKIDPATKSSAKASIRRGLNRELHVLMGITSTRLVISAEEPTSPCIVGDSPSSLEMSGSSRPMKKSIAMDVDTPEAIAPITTQR